MKNIKLRLLVLVFLSVSLIAFAGAGCDSEPDVIEDAVEDQLNEFFEDDNDLPDPGEPEPIEPSEPAEEPAVTPSTYYWPWLSHGHLDLSSGEIIAGPDLFESDLGFIAEFTEEHSYDGLVVWLVEDSDVFALEWVTLSFDVEYFKDSDWAYDINFEFRIEGLQPEPGEEGVREFTVSLAEEQQGFEVAINRVLLGKEQEGSLSATPIDFVALEIEMNVVGNP